MITDNKHYINAIKLHGHLLVLHGIYVTICWTSDDCDGQVDLKLHLSVGQVILFPYFLISVLLSNTALNNTTDWVVKYDRIELHNGLGSEV